MVPPTPPIGSGIFTGIWSEVSVCWKIGYISGAIKISRGAVCWLQPLPARSSYHGWSTYIGSLYGINFGGVGNWVDVTPITYIWGNWATDICCVKICSPALLRWLFTTWLLWFSIGGVELRVNRTVKLVYSPDLIQKIIDIFLPSWIVSWTYKCCGNGLGTRWPRM